MRFPLFVAGQAALAEDNQTRVHVDVEKPDKIARVACNDDKVIFESVVPDFRVRFPRQTDISNNVGPVKSFFLFCTTFFPHLSIHS